MFRDLVTGRELAWQLAARDIRAQYRQTALGYLWIFVLPVANTAVWLFMQSAGVITARDTGIPYPVFVLTGTILWSIFMDALNAPLQQAVVAKPMLAKINFPREALILSGLYQTVFNAAVRLLVLVCALTAMGYPPNWGGLLIPLALLALILAGTAIGLCLTPLGLLYGDVGRGLPLLLQFLMFLSPVVYPVPRNGLAAAVMEANPLTPLLGFARAAVTGQSMAMWGWLAAVCAGFAVLLVLGWLGYRVSMPILIERMSA